MPRTPSIVYALTLTIGVLLSACTEVAVVSHVAKKSMSQETTGGCRNEGALKVGNPYVVDGKQYQPIKTSLNYRERGIASWYGGDFHNKATANGECFNMYSFTAAHKTLPLPTIARVTNMENGRSIVVKVNDRGPFVGSRLIDLSYASAEAIGMARGGTAPVLVEAIGGPHNYPNGMQDYLALKGKQPGMPVSARANLQADSLPSVVPSTTSEEDLAPQSFTNRVAARAQAQAAAATENINAAPSPVREAVVADSTPVLPPNDAKPSALPPAPERAEVPFSNPAPLHNSRVYVQTGAYSNKAGAESELATLRKLDAGARIDTITRADGAPLYRVRTGPFNSVADAESTLAKVRNGFTKEDVAAGSNAGSGPSFPQAQIKVEQ